MKILNRSAAVFLILTLLVIATYSGIFSLYYLNDEWRVMGTVEVNGIGSAFRSYTIPQLLLGKGRPLGTLLNEIGYSYFPFRPEYFTTVSIIFHTLNSFLAYLVIRKIFRSGMLAFLTAVFMAVSAGAYQSLYWIATELQVTLSMFFGLSSVMMSLKYKDSGNPFSALLSAIYMYLAFLTKEASVVFVLFIPAVFFVYTRGYPASSERSKRMFRILIPVIFLTGFLLLWFYRKTLSDSGDPFLPAVFLRSIFNVFYYPLVTLPYFLFPDLHIWVRDFFTGTGIIDSGIWMMTPLRIIIPDLAALLFTATAAYFLYGTYRKTESMRMPLALGGILYAAAFIPVAFHLVTRYEPVIEPYLLYYHMFGVGLLGASVCVPFLRKRYGSRKDRPDPLASYVIALVIGFQIFTVWHITSNNRYLGRQSRKLTAVLLTERAHFPDNPVVFLSGSRIYGFEKNTLPYWLGSGYIYSVINYPSGKIPATAIVNQKFSGFGEEGYIVDDGKTFAFFQDLESLRKFLSEKPSLIPSLVAYYWDDRSETLRDISDVLKEKVTGGKIP